MADSPAKRHLSRVRAAEEAARRRDGDPMDGCTEYQLQMLQLQDHRLRLKNIQSEEGKAALKREILPDYAPYLAGILQADAGGQNEVVTTAMVWSIDAGDFESALLLADYVLRHKLAMPDRFSRTTGCLVAEEIAEAALKAQQADHDFDPAVLARAAQLTANEDMPDQVRAKLFLAAGRGVIRTATDEAPPSVEALQQCVTDLKRAIELHDGCGGKKDLERAERLLRKQTAPSG